MTIKTNRRVVELPQQILGLGDVHRTRLQAGINEKFRMQIWRPAHEIVNDAF